MKLKQIKTEKNGSQGKVQNLTHMEFMRTKEKRSLGTAKNANVTPEQWWEQISLNERKVAQQIALMMRQVTESKRIEIRREKQEIRVRFIHILKQPENGCASAIVLPEVPADWN